MTYNKERHKQLVIRSQDLKNQGKNLFLENPEEDSELSKYNIAVEEHVFWTLIITMGYPIASYL